MEARELHIHLDPGRRASDDIYEQLRALITSGALKPGDRLPSERAMMAELQRSRPTIREALKRLEQGFTPSDELSDTPPASITLTFSFFP